jgi:hypothetical protein
MNKKNNKDFVKSSETNFKLATNQVAVCSNPASRTNSLKFQRSVTKQFVTLFALHFHCSVEMSAA